MKMEQPKNNRILKTIIYDLDDIYYVMSVMIDYHNKKSSKSYDINSIISPEQSDYYDKLEAIYDKYIKKYNDVDYDIIIEAVYLYLCDNKIIPYSYDIKTLLKHK